MKSRQLMVVVTALCIVAVTGAWAQKIQGAAGDLYRKAQTEVAAGRLEQAKGILEQALKQAQAQPDAVIIAGTLAQVWAALGKYDEAKAFLTVQGKKSGFSGYIVELARLIMRSEPNGAVEAADLLRAVTQREQANVEAWLEYGRALARAGRYEDAMKALERITRSLAPKDLRAHYALAEVYMMRGDFKRGRNILIDALKIDPDAPETHCWIGKAFERDRVLPGADANAVMHYEDAYRLDKASAMYLGHVLFNTVMGYNHAAANGQAKRLQKHSGDSVALWYDGLKKEQEGDVAGAIKLLQSAVAANPNNLFASFALAHLYCGSPTPGFGIIRGVRLESWRYLPHRNPRQAASELARIKLLDPTFPHVSSLESLVTGQLAAGYPSSSSSEPDPESVQRYQKMIGYFRQLQMTR
ncbi:MAG: tetratricopeptide repeat protein [Candidatus Riflebacteria bacterium]|nr:tetratricopeptide repeat protein [Candidatus Riflebacteria bacterium]